MMEHVFSRLWGRSDRSKSFSLQIRPKSTWPSSSSWFDESLRTSQYSFDKLMARWLTQSGSGVIATKAAFRLSLPVNKMRLEHQTFLSSGLSICALNSFRSPGIYALRDSGRVSALLKFPSPSRSSWSVAALWRFRHGGCCVTYFIETLMSR